MSDEKKVTHPRPDDPEAIHWTAGDARRTFHEKGEERPDPRQESDRKRTTASTPLRRTDSRGAQGEKAPNQQASFASGASAGTRSEAHT